MAQQYNFNNRQGGAYVQYTRGGSAMKGKNINYMKPNQDDLYNSGNPEESPFKTMY